MAKLINSMSNLNRNLLWLLGASLVGGAVYFFSDIVTYILIAWVLSMLGRPLMVFFMRRIRFGRFRVGAGSAALLTILSFYLLLFGLLMAFVPTIVSQARHLKDVDYQVVGEKLREPFAYLDYQAHQFGVLKSGESLATKSQELLSQWFKPALLGDFLGSFVSVAGNLFVTFAAVTFILFFFLKENSLFMDILHALVPNDMETKVRHAIQESSEVLTRYFGGLLAQMFSFSLMVTVFLWIMGVPNAMLIGFAGGLFNVIPFVGPLLGFAFGAFITISSHVDAEFALIGMLLLKVGGSFAATQFFDNNFIGPMIFSKSVQAHPLEIFLVTLAAAKIGGVAGMVLGIPVYTVLRVIARVFFSEFKVVQRWTEHLEEDE
jgi:predicted PurR-regulated permease PerM